jgi:small basic protein (TIGR04137 family)
MSRDKSLKSASSLTRHRNVLNRMERIEKLREEERWKDGRSPFGLQKVAHRKASVGGKEKKEKKEEAAATEEAPKK